MREILFKAKRKDNGEWVEGNLIISKDVDEGYETIIIPQREAYMYTTDISTDLGFESWYVVIPDTLCQYTGYKDKNGRKIWENDIVECAGNTLVQWNEKYAGWCLTQRKWMYEHFFGEAIRPCDSEVIGNVIDNPELLKL